jgi:hypothetical protein
MNSQASLSLDRDDDTLTKENRLPQETPDDTAGPRSIRSHVVRWMREDWPHLVGGFPDWPLFEDVELARRVRRCSRVAKLPSPVTNA